MKSLSNLPKVIQKSSLLKQESAKNKKIKKKQESAIFW